MMSRNSTMERNFLVKSLPPGNSVIQEVVGYDRISRSGLDPKCIRNGFQRFGTGFYLARNSSKSHDYTQSYNGFKAILLCDVLPGRKYVVQTDRQHLQGPPTGYDSVYGNVGKDLNYPELVVYNPDAVLP